MRRIDREKAATTVNVSVRLVDLATVNYWLISNQYMPFSAAAGVSEAVRQFAENLRRTGNIRDFTAEEATDFLGSYGLDRRNLRINKKMQLQESYAEADKRANYEVPVELKDEAKLMLEFTLDFNKKYNRSPNEEEYAKFRKECLTNKEDDRLKVTKYLMTPVPEDAKRLLIKGYIPKDSEIETLPPTEGDLSIPSNEDQLLSLLEQGQPKIAGKEDIE